MKRFFAPLVPLVAVLFMSTPAEAFRIRIPIQLTVMPTVILSPTTPGGFAGAELHASASIVSLGVFFGIAYEHLDEYNGGAANLGIQWRPVQMDKNIWKTFDPYIGLGATLGGGRHNGDSVFRGGGFLQLGFDVTVPGRVNFGAQYRLEYAGTPSATQMHVFLVGIGFRLAED